MSHSYLLLACAVAFEVLWATMLKLSHGFSVFWASVVMVIAYFASLGCLNVACRSIALSMAYPVWTGLGGTIVALIGVFAFKEPFGVARALGVLLVISGVTLLLGFESRTAGG